MLARAYGSISTDPLFGHAVQAPMVSEPKATPRLSVNQVALRPRTAATKKVKQDPNNSRMVDPARNQSPRAAGARSAAVASASVRVLALVPLAALPPSSAPSDPAAPLVIARSASSSICS